MPEGKKTAVPAPKPVREEDLYSAKTHLHQPVPVQETATVSATAQLADAPEGALPSEDQLLRRQQHQLLKHRPSGAAARLKQWSPLIKPLL